jgi:ABC-type multidrug transport system permease subunit
VTSGPPDCQRKIAVKTRSALAEMTLSRIREFIREPEAVFWVFAFPVLLAIALGFAFREKPPDRIPIGVVAEGGGAASPTAKILESSPALLVRTYDARSGAEALRTGKISLLVEPGTAGAPVHFRYDETRPDSRVARLEANESLQRAAGRTDVTPTRSTQITDKGARYIDFLVPGLLGMNLMGTGIWSLAFSITNARNRRILKRLIATPMRKRDFLLAQVAGRLVFLLPEIVFLVGAAWLMFGVSVRGSLAAFLLLCFLGSLAFCGIGLLVAARVRTIEGASGLANLVLLPMWILSGTFFSSERFPDAAQPYIAALPLTALNEALRAVMNEGASLAQVAPKLGILAAWGIGCFLVALKLFRWK